MADRVVECVANFSEGRRTEVVDRIASAIRSRRVCVLDRTSDFDHNRSVLTFAGRPEDVADAAIAAVGIAADFIDLNTHRGVHPRIGAADVVPFVPLEGVSLDDCVRLSIEVGEEIWRRWGIPVYLYEASARRPERKRLENVRRGGFENLRNEANSNPDRAPDIGGPGLHPTAGATVVGARKFLIAYNVNLGTNDITIAKTIAARIRESSGGLPCVKALGLMLKTRNKAQVSVNLTDYEVTPLRVVYEAIRRHAREFGVETATSELIGLIPRAAIADVDVHEFRFENFDEMSTVEARLQRARIIEEC